MQRCQTSTVATATKLALLLLWLLGGAWPVAAAPDVCVLAPLVDPAGAAPASLPVALVPLRQPTVFIREPLAEVRLEREGVRGNRLLWQAQPPTGSSLEGPLAWPLPPLQPGQRLTLRLRPIGVEPDQFATIRLQAAPLLRLEAGDALLRSLLAGPATAWRPAIEGLLAQGDRSLATALLFANEGPNEPALNALRLQAVRESCR